MPPSGLAYPELQKQTGVVDIRARENWSREQILSHQEKSFRQLVIWAWNHSPFYHDYYQDHGIREGQLADLTPRDVPMVSKELLMEDENVVEILDHRDQPVAPGEKGRVVLTNLGNRAMPIIRYEMRDIVTRGLRRQNEPFDPILAVDGRTNDALPIRSRNGSVDTIHPGVLAEFFVPGIIKCQFEGVSPDEITLRYLAPMSLDQEIEREFQKILSLKEANPNVQVNITRVTNLSADEKTGKFRLVILRQPGSSRCFT